ncbi:MAG: DNA-directed RNA polymerase subunit beta' [Parcubacteria group bacterium Licking1014_17]|nr:MAG: DNA-directed RNA polymerase subunit beta' [Parcubacteria group bacterium Licking1014_17]
MNFSKLKLKIASPEEILKWSHGEVTKAETINYRTQKPEKEGLFSEAIFGPTKDWECYCGKYRRIRYKGIICDRCGVEVTRSIVRRERMGHIKLATSVAHIWFLRNVPSRIGMILDVPLPELERVIYFASYIIMRVNEDVKTEAMKKLESEFRSLIKNAPAETEREELKERFEKEKENLRNLKKHKVLSELDHRELSLKYGEVFEANIGAEAIRLLLEEIDLEEEVKKCEKHLAATDNPVSQKKIARRMKTIRGMAKAGVRPEWMIITVLPIIPPLLRPMVPLDGGRFATSDLNDLYRRVINRNNRLKHLLELKAPEVITKNEKRMLQEAVDALIDNSMRHGQTLIAATTGQRRPLKSLADMLKGKQGRFRQNLLGKRVDYSGRSVIVIGPDLKLSECGLPKYMALELFKPFIINYLINTLGIAHNIKSANILIDQEVPEVWEALEHSIKDKLVLLNRAPTLHRLGIQAFKPILIEGRAIKIPALPTKAFNADFDGDQMAVHLPLTNEAQEEARDLMYSIHGILKPATGEPVAVPSRDIVFGCFYMTSINTRESREKIKNYSSESEAMLAYYECHIKLRSPIKVKITNKAVNDSESKIIETSIGRILFNKALPDDYPFVNKKLNQSDLRNLEADILEKYGEERTVAFLDASKSYGFHYATISGASWGMDDLRVPPEKKKIIQEAEKLITENNALYSEGLLTEYERKMKSQEVWTLTKSKLEQLIIKQSDSENPIHMMVESKARGSWSVANQLAGMRGLFSKPDGELVELPVKSSFKEGLNVLEYFISTHGARKGLVDTALKTAHAGYLTRRLVDVAQDVVIQEEDCKDKEGYTIYADDYKYIGENIGKRLRGRTLLEDIKDTDGKVIAKKNQIVDKQTSVLIDTAAPKSVKVRSPITCKAKDGICKMCYGFDLSKNEPVKIGEAVGIVTAQAIGEPGTQLTMRTFHTGGVAGSIGSDITMGLPRVEEIFEARSPSAKAAVSNVEGQVVRVDEKNNSKIIAIRTGKGEEIEYAALPGSAASVAVGDLVTPGQQLSEGNMDFKELYRITKNIATVARCIVREVKSIYIATGESINDKHVELIVKQMFSRVEILDPGDTELLSGDVIEKRTMLETNEMIENSGGKPATHEQLLLGITKVSLTTDSYLSAASFMQTANVLIDASILGKEDTLRGLKENVIIGRLIPAGTGYKYKNQLVPEPETKIE